MQGRDSRLGLLAHTTLKALEQQLAEASLAVVRIHRTTIVNQAYAREVRPDRKSDFAISLADGTVLRGSRRYSRTSRQRNGHGRRGPGALQPAPPSQGQGHRAENSQSRRSFRKSEIVLASTMGYSRVRRRRLSAVGA